MTINNGWISVLDTEHRPESGEEILTLSYVGDEPDSPDPFADPDDRAYCLCTYFYPGDQDWNEVPGDPATLTPTEQAEVTFDEEGFYVNEPMGPREAMTWRRVKTVAENKWGIACWNHLDYPTGN